MLLLLSTIEYVLGFVLTPIFFKRFLFEKKYCSEFKFQADYCFEFSSEGEFARIRPLVNKYLNEGKKIELIFCSKSVAETIENLAFRYQNQIRYRAYPFFYRGQNLSSWITAKKLGLVRYDFFPRLIYIGSTRQNFSLYSAVSRYLKHPILKRIYLLFHEVFASSPTDAKKISHFLKREVPFKEFRIDEINERISKSEETILSKMKFGQELIDYLENDSREKVILGSFWSDELDNNLLREFLGQDKQFFVFAHSSSDISAIHDKLSLLGKVGTPDQLENKYIVIETRGVLCEFYSYFDLAYVGGGFRETIHSVLEPILSGCKVFIGPNVHKSSEYQLALEYAPERITILR